METDLEKQDLAMQSGNSSKPFVAVWMVTYNHGLYIEQAIESVMMQQTDFPYKLFVGEDCSTDDTAEICRRLQQKYPDKIELFLNEKNSGPHPNAMKIYKACFESGASYIAMLEGDDYWTDTGKLQKQIDFLQSNLDYVLCFHEVVILSNGEITNDFLTKVPDGYETIETFARLGNYIHTPSVVFRNVLQSLPDEFKFAQIGDYFLYMVIAEYGKFKCLPEKMAVYRYGIGIFSGKSVLNLAKNNVKLFACLLSYLKDAAIKKIIFNRYLEAVALLEKSIDDQYKDYFISDHAFFRALKFIKQPLVLIKKIGQKVLKNPGKPLK